MGPSEAVHNSCQENGSSWLLPSLRISTPEMQTHCIHLAAFHGTSEESSGSVGGAFAEDPQDPPQGEHNRKLAIV